MADYDEVFADLTVATVYLTKPSMSALYGLAAEMGLSRTDCINRALGLYGAVVSLEPGQALTFDHPGSEPRSVVRLDSMTRIRTWPTLAVTVSALGIAFALGWWLG